jgi:hypothetical protein
VAPSHFLTRFPALVVGFLLLVGAGSPAGTAGNGAVAPAFDAVAHDLHVAYADVAVEGAVLAARIRIFKDDLERALGSDLGVDAVQLDPGPEADALVLRYLRRHLRLEREGAELVPEILQSGEDLLDREPIWWVVVQYRAAGPVEELTVRNTILLELFDDQRNVVKFVRFPDETSRTFYFAHGEEERRVRLDRARPGGGPA